FSTYSRSSSAPATQPIHSSMLRRISSGTEPRTTTSDTAKRPPGLSTRNASASTRSLSPERLITQLEMITSTDASGSGIASIRPPEPRSSTVSPSWSSANAVGLPQPSDARSAAEGRPWVSPTAYRSRVMGSLPVPHEDEPQQLLAAPDAARRAACPYFFCTTSNRSDTITSVLHQERLMNR